MQVPLTRCITTFFTQMWIMSKIKENNGREDQQDILQRQMDRLTTRHTNRQKEKD